MYKRQALLFLLFFAVGVSMYFTAANVQAATKTGFVTINGDSYLSLIHILDYELFTKTIGQAAKNVHKRLRQVEYRTQAPDHPILWAADAVSYTHLR